MRAIGALVWFLLAVGLTAPSRADSNIVIYSAGKISVGESRQLTVYVPLSPNTVTLSVNGVPGGDSTYGTISATGLYQAPAAIPAQNNVVITAVSTAYPAKTATATMIVSQPQVQLWSTSPTTVSGTFTLRLNGSNFTPQSQVKFGDTVLTTQYKSATSLTATGTVSTAQAGTKVKVAVVNPGLGGTTSSTVSVTVGSSGSGGTTPTPTNPSDGGGSATPTTPTPTPTNPSDGSTTPPAPSVSIRLTPTGVTLRPNATQQFTASVSGSSNTGVVYSVNGAVGGNATVGTITTGGLYTAPANVPTNRITVSATAAASSSASATAAVTLQGPPNPGVGLGTGNLAAARFLEQATFGPTPADVTKLKAMGAEAWLAEQFNMPATDIPLPGAMQSGLVQQQYLSRLTTAPDQLRQRVAYVLGSIIVISMNKNIYPAEIVPYLQILSRNAFGNYRTLLGEISVSSQMGKYLDLARSMKPGSQGGTNENYAREVMQLFSLGLVALNQDGSVKLGADGKPIPTYDQTTVQQIALAMTGWVYKNNAWEDFSAPMEPRETNHDTRAKAFLGCNLPANQTTTQDMTAALDCIFAHPNVGPFISTRLIRQLVTSNPTPEYIGRVAAVFNDNGAGVRGDLKAVVTAILTDAEARTETPSFTGGRLRDPIQHVAAFLRALNGSIAPTNGLPWQFSQMASTPLTPPSVFGYYSPLYRIPKSSLMGPEFQTYTPTESVFRGNLFWQIISSPSSDFTRDVTPFVNAANDTVALIDAVDQTLMYGRMPAEMRQSLATAIVAQSDTAGRWQTALYLGALSGFYATQY